MVHTRRVLLLAVVTCFFVGLPPVASAHHLPWKTINTLVAKKLQSHVDGLASYYNTNDQVWGQRQRVKASPHFGQYWMHVYGYVYGTTCYIGVCGLQTQFYFTCVSWVDFKYASRFSRRYSVASVPGDCYSFWIDNVAACGGGPCIPGFTPGDTVPPATVPSTQFEWTRSWAYWPTIYDPPF